VILEDVPQDIGIKTLKVWYACVSVLVYACMCVCVCVCACVCVPSICVLESLYLHFLDFAVNGRQKRTKHKGEWGEYKGDQWENRDGDVIGLACDLDEMQMHVSLNGSFASLSDFEDGFGIQRQTPKTDTHLDLQGTLPRSAFA